MKLLALPDLNHLYKFKHFSWSHHLLFLSPVCSFLHVSPAIPPLEGAISFPLQRGDIPLQVPCRTFHHASLHVGIGPRPAHDRIRQRTARRKSRQSFTYRQAYESPAEVRFQGKGQVSGPTPGYLPRPSKHRCIFSSLPPISHTHRTQPQLDINIQPTLPIHHFLQKKKKQTQDRE